MFSVQMPKKWISFCVLLASSWIHWFADGSCLYPGHRSNEIVKFSSFGTNDIFTTGTIAMFYCENDSIKDRFKELQCHANGSWIFRWAKSDHRQCALTIVNRCQRLTPAGISEPLKTIIIDNICINLHYGLIDPTKINLETTCNTAIFRTSQAIQLGSHYYSTNEEKEICKTFEFPKHQSLESGAIVFLTRTTQAAWPSLRTPTDGKWLQDFSHALSHNSPRTYYPNCPFLQCYSHKNPVLFAYIGCEISQRYWICRHDISSCGIPNQKPYSLMKFSGIYVGNVAKYRCYDGYTTTDNLTRECHSNGLWFSKAPQCRLVDCGTPSPNESVTFVLTNNSTTFGSSLNYTCKSLDHYMNGSQYSTCQADGKWHGEEPICIPIDQEQLPLSQFGLNPGEVDLLKLIVAAVAGITVVLIAFMWLVLAAVLYSDKRKHQNPSKEPQMQTHNN